MSRHGLTKNMRITLYRNGKKIDVGRIVNADDLGEVLHVITDSREYRFLFWEKGTTEFTNDTHTFEEDGWREVEVGDADDIVLYADMLYEFVPLQVQ